jgi:hypothetical protein
MSVSKRVPEWRWITPHAFGSDGLRWHVRAYCHQDEKFKDFLLSRCGGARGEGSLEAQSVHDRFWDEFFDVELSPNPDLSAEQQNAIASDFGMKNWLIIVPVRRAMLYHFLRRMRFDAAGTLDSPKEVPVVIRNREAFDEALAEAMS